MNRRFKETLMALAIAAVSASAFAMAPVISFIKSPIIVDDTPATAASNFFVYPDAMNLDSMGSDDTVATSAIIWSYTSAGQPLGQGRYMINGTTALNPALDDPNAPIAAKKITSNDDTGTNGSQPGGGTVGGIRDGNVRTLTFRDITLSPLNGSNSVSGVGAGAIAASQSITLFASDGTTYSQKTFFAYTAEAGGAFPIDRLSSFAPTVTPVGTVVPQNVTNGGTLGWTSSTVLGAATFTATTNNGLCLGTAVAGSNFAEWISPYKIINLVANSVYRIRITMDDNSATGIAAGLTPLFDFAIDNFDTNNPATTENKYSADWINLDNFTSGTVASPNANGVGTTGAGQHVFDIWYAPAPVSATDWNDASSGEFISTHDAGNDMRIQFRVLDLANTANPNAETADTGTLCIRNINVTRIPLSSLHVAANLYDVSTISAATHSVSALFGTNIVGGAQTANAHTTVDFTGGAVTVSPNTAGTYTDGSAAQTQGGAHAWDIEAITVASGNTVTAASTGGTPADNDDNWPFLWVPGQLLMSTITAVAPNAQSAVNPPDGLQFAFDSPTTEILQGSIILASANVLGMPKTTPTQYKAFFYTQAGTNQSAAVANHNNRLRVQTSVLLNPSLASGGQPTNTGGVKFTEFKVDQLDLPSN